MQGFNKSSVGNGLEMQERRTLIVKFDQARADGVRMGRFNLVIANG